VERTDRIKVLAPACNDGVVVIDFNEVLSPLSQSAILRPRFSDTLSHRDLSAHRDLSRSDSAKIYVHYAQVLSE